jgi:hypothetical protein
MASAGFTFIAEPPQRRYPDPTGGGKNRRGEACLFFGANLTEHKRPASRQRDHTPPHKQRKVRRDFPRKVDSQAPGHVTLPQ